MRIKVELELNPEEVKHLSNFCILRAIKSAGNALPYDYDYLTELLEAGQIYEDIRQRLVNELFRLKAI